MQRGSCEQLGCLLLWTVIRWFITYSCPKKRSQRFILKPPCVQGPGTTRNAKSFLRVCWTTPTEYRGSYPSLLGREEKDMSRIFRPSVPPNVQNSILAHLVGILDGIADYQRARCLRARARKKDSATTNGASHCSSPMDLASKHQAFSADTLTDQDTAASSEPPPIFKSLIFGINAVTKYLETQIANCRLKTVFQSSTKDMEQASEEHNTIRYLFVCRADIDPPILIDHLPHLVATYNVLRGSDVPPTILIPLPKGAEATLAQAVGVRRLAVLAIDVRRCFSFQHTTNASCRKNLTSEMSD